MPNNTRIITCALAAIAGAFLIGSQAKAQQIFACITQQGTLKVVAQNVPCSQNETRISWNVAGPPGPVGPQGPAGPPGAVGPAGPSDVYFANGRDFLLNNADPQNPTIVVSLSVPPGNYSITAVVPVLNATENPAAVACWLTPITPIGPDGIFFGGTFSLGLVNLPRNLAILNPAVDQMTLIGTAVFLINSTITVSCVGNAGVNFPGIMATRVGALHQ